MKYFFFLISLMFIGAAGWKIGGELSSDALGMALGILLGIMASIPTALLVLAARRRDVGDDWHSSDERARLARRIRQLEGDHVALRRSLNSMRLTGQEDHRSVHYRVIEDSHPIVRR